MIDRINRLMGYRLPALDGEIGHRRGKKCSGSLRSARVVSCYRVYADHNVVGHLRDFLADKENWKIQSCVVDSGSRLNRKRLLISPTQIDRITWDASTMHLNVPQPIVMQSPAFKEFSIDESAREWMTVSSQNFRA